MGLNNDQIVECNDDYLMPNDDHYLLCPMMIIIMGHNDQWDLMIRLLNIANLQYLMAFHEQ